jgi:iron(III) transport system substrate-binding protein
MQRRNLIRLATVLSVTLALPMGATAADGKLVVYTSQPSKDAQATVDAFTKVHPNVDVEWIRDGTTKVMAKLHAEFAAGAPKPDVLLMS